MSFAGADCARPGSAATGTKDALLGCKVAARYEVVRHLSTGGMASVYEAIDAQSHARVALKVLHPHHARRPTVVRRFQREAQVVDGLDPGYVAPVRDSGCWDGVHYLTMDLLIGQDLRQLLQNAGRLAVSQAVDVALDVCRGLRAAHARGLVHRDIKPSNIFIAQGEDGSQRATLLDFGIAKYASCGDSTDEFSLLGTIGYMAPEQVVSSKQVDHRVDIYSVGLVLYEALSGTPAYRGERTQVLYEIVHGPPVSLEHLDGALPGGLTRAILEATARDPDHRHADVQALAAALAPFAGNGVLCPEPTRATRSGAHDGQSPSGAGTAQLLDTRPDPPSQNQSALDAREISGRPEHALGVRFATLALAAVMAGAMIMGTLALLPATQQAARAASTRQAAKQLLPKPAEDNVLHSPRPSSIVSKPDPSNTILQKRQAADATDPSGTPAANVKPVRQRATPTGRLLPPGSAEQPELGGARLVIHPGTVFASDNPYDG